MSFSLAGSFVFDADADAKWMQRNLDRLAHAEVAVSNTLSGFAIPEFVFPRECFQRAAYYTEAYIEENPVAEFYYVLGEALCGGLQQHGWVELPGNIVFDGVLQRFYDQTKYYLSEFAKPWYRFTPSAVQWLLGQRLKSWRWDCELKLPWADCAHNPNAAVLVVDLEKAQAFLQAKRRTRAIAKKSKKYPPDPARIERA